MSRPTGDESTFHRTDKVTLAGTLAHGPRPSGQRHNLDWAQPQEGMCSVKESKKQQVIINTASGDECRIAILENGILEEFFSERTTESLHVGNIYLGSVVNVEPAIQAAFVDFGIGRNGFLHISDVHPKYFPGKGADETESVGRKTPHRERPPIQECLKRGQQIVVQVIKEGIGTKGPTLTSYPSIPGRYLVMMPDMEHHGVTRKLEDLDERREAKKILNALELPKEFGFILRTAGLSRSKLELKRDLAYLARLWKDIEKKQKKVRAPKELYAESDLLVRTIRDVISPEVERIWVDDPKALQRLDEYLRIATPRQRKTKLCLHHRPTPIFHDFGVEPQLQTMYQREVPLKCGGSIVIDSAEAMVAIDVNSGRTRKFRDAETMAHQVNLEAVDEIARQLRLRDLGGLIVLDLIDMRESRHQRAVETRLRDLLKRDRAKSETGRISRFGILEMTRQRMRPAIQKTHFVECAHCAGQGHIKSSEAVLSDALRHLSYLLYHDRIQRVEMVVSAESASVLLSRKRQMLAEIEERTGKLVDIRISKAIPTDQVDFYAYDNRNSDIDLEQLKVKYRNPAQAEPDPMPDLEPLPAATTETEAPKVGTTKSAAGRAESEAEDGDESAEPTRRKRSRRRRRRGARDEASGAVTTDSADQGSRSSGSGVRPKNARNETDDNAMPAAVESPADAADSTTSTSGGDGADGEAEGKKASSKTLARRRRRTRSKERTQSAATAENSAEPSHASSEDKSPTASDPSAEAVTEDPVSENSESTKKPRRRKRTRKAADTRKESSTKRTEATTEAVASTTDPSTIDAPPKKKTSRRKKTTRKTADAATASGELKKKKTSRTRTRTRKAATTETTSAEAPTPLQADKPAAESKKAEVQVEPKRRRLYGSRRRLRPDEISNRADHEE